MESSNSGGEKASKTGLNPNAAVFVSKYFVPTHVPVTNANQSFLNRKSYINSYIEDIKYVGTKSNNYVMDGYRVPLRFSQQNGGPSYSFNIQGSSSFDWRNKYSDKNESKCIINGPTASNEIPEAKKLTAEANLTRSETRKLKAGNTNVKEDKIKEQSKDNSAKLEKLKTKYLKSKKVPGVNTAENQRERLEEELEEGSCECMVCCGVVHRKEAVWSCACCSHIFHLKCIHKWASSPNSQILSNQPPDVFTSLYRTRDFNTSGDVDISTLAVSGRDVGREGASGGVGVVKWRCPTCQQVTKDLPQHYFCFCGKQKNPKFSGYQVPHSCGEVCGRKRGARRGVDSHCDHPCTLLCHPGPCPPCSAFTMVKCLCAGKSLSVKCSQAKKICCKEGCQKVLNCGKHACLKSCHSPPCQTCELKVEQKCGCGKGSRRVLCGSQLSFLSSFQCGKTCDKRLDCDNHNCTSPCHPGPCPSCPLLPSNVKHCPCGGVTLAKIGGEERKSCLDPISCCGGVCRKEFQCGEEGMPHKCWKKCHEGGCGDCVGVSRVACRCGATMNDVKCVELALKVGGQNNGGGKADGGSVNGSGEIADSLKLDKLEEGETSNGGVRRTELRQGGVAVTCDIRCGRKMSCGRHKCLNHCCSYQLHECLLVCGYKLSCKQHRCQEQCHRGRCQQCWNVSWDELRCHCGAQVLYPPIQCGVLPPSCQQNCIRVRPCGHQSLHPCHHEPSCPPCTILVDRVCLCGKEDRKNVPCYLTEVYCGLPCSKVLPCKIHCCRKTCHKDSCSTDSPCIQPCSLPRISCSHPCNHPCHPGKPCPPGVCHYEIVGKCACGRKKHGRMLCLKEEKSEREADYNGVDGGQGDAKAKDKMANQNIACDSECEKIKRNRRLAEALGIDQQQHITQPANYPQSVLDYYQKNAKFCREIELVLTDLVNSVHQNATASSGSRKYHYFKPMSLNHRIFIHEVAPSFGCESESHDLGSQRSVIASASKFLSKLPSTSIDWFLKYAPK